MDQTVMGTSTEKTTKLSAGMKRHWCRQYRFLLRILLDDSYSIDWGMQVLLPRDFSNLPTANRRSSIPSFEGTQRLELSGNLRHNTRRFERCLELSAFRCLVQERPC